jgi:vacuolar-type H+-ATPase subunit D/Vma8
MNEVRELPRLPDAFNVPDALVQAWMKIPSNQPLTFQVTREHIDQLFFSLMRLSQSSTKLQSCLLLYTQGKLNEANEAMAESQRATVEAENYARQFLAAVISSAVTNASS